MYKEVTLPSIAMASIPVMVITVVFTFLQVFLFDRKVKRQVLVMTDFLTNIAPEIFLCIMRTGLSGCWLAGIPEE